MWCTLSTLFSDSFDEGELVGLDAVAAWERDLEVTGTHNLKPVFRSDLVRRVRELEMALALSDMAVKRSLVSDSDSPTDGKKLMDKTERAYVRAIELYNERRSETDSSWVNASPALRRELQKEALAELFGAEKYYIGKDKMLWLEGHDGHEKVASELFYETDEGEISDQPIVLVDQADQDEIEAEERLAQERAIAADNTRFYASKLISDAEEVMRAAKDMLRALGLNDEVLESATAKPSVSQPEVAQVKCGISDAGEAHIGPFEQTLDGKDAHCIECGRAVVLALESD